MVHTSPSTTVSSSIGTTAPESLLVRYIKAHVRKGDQAKDKSEQHYIAAGRYLITLKVTYAPSWEEWEDLLRIKIGLSTGRASELMQIADGRKDLQQVRDGKAQSVARLRAQRSSLRSEEGNETSANPEIDAPRADFVATSADHRLRLSQSEDQRDRNPSQGAPQDPKTLFELRIAARGLIRDLISEAIHEMALKIMLDESDSQSRFDDFRNAVADLYQQLLRAGRR